MKYFNLDLLIEVPDELLLDNFEYEFRNLIEDHNWSATGKMIEVNKDEKIIEEKEQILTVI